MLQADDGGCDIRAYALQRTSFIGSFSMTLRDEEEHLIGSSLPNCVTQGN